jgi:hypothetical protein
MLRRLSDDLQNKNYARQASAHARPDQQLFEKIQTALKKKNNRAASSIRSVIRSKNTILIRATSRAAASELLTAQMLIREVIKDAGATQIRFTV